MALSLQARNELEQLADVLVKMLRRSLIEKGHVDTKKLHDSISVQLREGAASIALEGSFERHGVFQDRGVTADRIPYRRGSGAKSSMYIDALMKWVERKLGIPDPKSKSIAFAIAQTHKRVGMHSRGGRANPSAKGFMTEVLDKNEQMIAQRIEKVFDIDINIFVDNLVRGFEKQI